MGFPFLGLAPAVFGPIALLPTVQTLHRRWPITNILFLLWLLLSAFDIGSPAKSAIVAVTRPRTPIRFGE
jgi:hypothetical protein